MKQLQNINFQTNMEYINGVKLGRGEFDWVAGGNSAIKHDIIMPDKNWKNLEPFKTTEKKNI